MQLDDDTGLVCVVGANGTGKSHLLELIAASANRLGLSPGVEIPRGDPFVDPHSFTIEFHLAHGISRAVERLADHNPSFAAWDRSITISSKRQDEQSQTTIHAGGCPNDGSHFALGGSVVQALKTEESVYFLSLDADRAYPDRPVNAHQVAEAYERDWEIASFKRDRAFRSTATLYDEWKKYFLARENQYNNDFARRIRKSRIYGDPEPVFEDQFESFRDAIIEVLPHIRFVGADEKRRALLFDTTGKELTFNQLSGGEREIAFLIGQIDRFGLRQGLMLLDEPELHLNADLIREWVSYLTGTVEDGQIWLATHSLEAVEAAGQHATFVLERNERTREVDTLVRLDHRPALSALSRAVGTPAFAISQLLFVFVEGAQGIGERERFRKLCNTTQGVRFIECGSCNEVLRRLADINDIAAEADTGIRVGGIVDRDFRSDQEAETLSNANGICVLAVHEVENFFLHPPTLESLLALNGQTDVDPVQLVRNCADARAGSWVFQHAMATPNAQRLPKIATPAKERAKAMAWAEIDADRDQAIDAIAALSNYDEPTRESLRDIIRVSIRSYERRRDEPELWKRCEGKQVLNGIVSNIGFASPAAMLRSVFVLWDRDGAHLPEELLNMRDYLNGL